jgi:hypothetical protein
MRILFCENIPPVFSEHRSVFRDNTSLFHDNIPVLRDNIASPNGDQASCFGRRPPRAARRACGTRGITARVATIRPSVSRASCHRTPSLRSGPCAGRTRCITGAVGFPAGRGCRESAPIGSKFACSRIHWDGGPSQRSRTCTCQGDAPWTPGAPPPTGGPRRRPSRRPIIRLRPRVPAIVRLSPSRRITSAGASSSHLAAAHATAIGPCRIASVGASSHNLSLPPC